MISKRLFQVFDEMNVNDEKNKTATLPCSFTMVEAKSCKQGGLITMGVEAGILQKIFFGEMQPVLVVMDKKEYHRLEAIPLEDKLQQAEAMVERYESVLRLIQEQADDPDNDNDPGISLWNILNFCKEALTPKTTTNDTTGTNKG